MAATPKPKSLRSILIGKVKVKAKIQGLEDGSEEYRQWLKCYGGKPSCADMSEAELSALLDRIEGNPVKIKAVLPVASDRVAGQVPTAKQWRCLHSLALEAGWDGINGDRMLKHVRHTAKVDALEDCNRVQVSDCIKGLNRLVASAAKKRK